MYLALFLAVSISPGAPGQERGSPWKMHTIDDSSRGADGAKLADVNGDGLPDIAVGWEEGRMVRVYLHPGREKVHDRWPAVTVGEVRAPEDAVLVDLDGDGNHDVVSCCEGSTRTVFVHWAPADRERYLDPRAWTTTPFPALEKRGMWMFCQPVQIDGKHGVDLILGSKGEAEVGWLEAPADPRDLASWKWHPLYKAGWIMSLVAADIDGDGDVDILASDRKGMTQGCLWIENPGNPGAKWNVHRIGPMGKQVMFLDHADLDQDGLKDVLVGVGSRSLYWHRRLPGKEVAWETVALPYPDGLGTAKAVSVGDMNNDGKPDLVLTCENAQNASGVVWMSYSKSPRDQTWHVHEISGPRGVKFDLAPLIDLDGDGDLDVITTEERDRLGVVWYENPASKK